MAKRHSKLNRALKLDDLDELAAHADALCFVDTNTGMGTRRGMKQSTCSAVLNQHFHAFPISNVTNNFKPDASQHRVELSKNKMFNAYQDTTSIGFGWSAFNIVTTIPQDLGELHDWATLMKDNSGAHDDLSRFMASTIGSSVPLTILLDSAAMGQMRQSVSNKK